MQLVDAVRKADERKALTAESRLVYILSKVMAAALAGEQRIRVDAFVAWDIPEGDIVAKKIAKRLTKTGFAVSIKIKDSRVYGNNVRSYTFVIDWSIR